MSKEQNGVSSEFQNIIRHLGNGIYLEDEIEIEKYIRGSSPEETLELQNKFLLSNSWKINCKSQKRWSSRNR